MPAQRGVGPAQRINAMGARARKWTMESRWRTFLRVSDYGVPRSFDEASERFGLNTPYYLTQYITIGILIVLCGALVSGGAAFVVAVVIALLLAIIAISLTSRTQLSSSARFLVFITVVTCLFLPHTPSCSLAELCSLPSRTVTVFLWVATSCSGDDRVLVHGGHAAGRAVFHLVVHRFAPQTQASTHVKAHSRFTRTW